MHPAAQRIAVTNNTDAGSITAFQLSVIDDYGSLASLVQQGTPYYMPISVDLGGFNNYSVAFNGAFTQTSFLQRGSNVGGNTNTGTVAFWFKRGLGTAGRQILWQSGSASTTINGQAILQYSTGAGSTNCLQVIGTDLTGSTTYQLTCGTTMVDSTVWHSVQLIFNGQSTDPNSRLQIVFDQSTGFTTSNPPSSGMNLGLATLNQSIGKVTNLAVAFALNGKISEFYYVDGQALTSTSFTASTIGPPLPFGNFTGLRDSYLNFTNSTNLGLDFSGENNSFMLSVGLTSTQQTADHP
jgi:hypothetical protein